MEKKKKRRNHQHGERDHDIIDLTDLQQQPVREMAMHGFVGPPRQLSATGKAELLDAATTSGSGKEVSELSGPSEPVAHELAETFAPVAYELMTHGTADGRSMIQNHGARSKYTIFVSTNVSSQSWTSIGTSTDIPCVGTTICSQKPKTVDLDRSLPPTPISESPQISPVIADFSGSVTTRKGSEAFVERPAAGKSVCGTIGRVLLMLVLMLGSVSLHI